MTLFAFRGVKSHGWTFYDTINIGGKSVEKYDVIVLGGGTAGMIAATASARSGARTLLVERDGYLGGTATMGIPFLGFFSGNGTKVVGGLPQELVDRMGKLGGCIGHAHGGTWSTGIQKIDYEFVLTPFDPECLKFASQEMALEAGVDLMFQAVLCDVQIDGPKVKAINVITVEGEKTLEAEVFIDCTGDAMLTWMAEFPTEMRGRGNMQNVSHVIRLANVDVDRMVQCLREGAEIEGINDWHIRLVRGKLLDDAEEGYVHVAGKAKLWDDRAPLTFTGVRWRKGEMTFNITRTTNIDPTIAEDITRAEISERKNVASVVKAFKEKIPGFEKIYLVASSVRVGIREGRKIKGLYTLTEQEVVNRSEFEDGIARGAYPIDVHDPKGGNTQFTFIKEGGSYGVPYRCLIPDGSDNLIVAGRCISATGQALGSVRLMACCMAQGQAAGIAAALATQSDISPAGVDITQLKDKLINEGAILTV